MSAICQVENNNVPEFSRIRKLIFSRKGFDSSAGGCPNPILPDGRLLPLPIPDKCSPICYDDLIVDGVDVGKLVTDLTRGRLRGTSGAHLDPDIDRNSLTGRPQSWRPVLGQHGSADGHLKNQGVGQGDLMLFFGLFQRVNQTDGRWQFDRTDQPRHLLWGWLQIGRCFDFSERRDWLDYHPHSFLAEQKNNTAYVAMKHSENTAESLAGLFAVEKEKWRLTEPSTSRAGCWRLPACFYPGDGKQPLSYHQNRERWSLLDSKESPQYCRLQLVSRGQEFVLPMQEYEAVKVWLNEIFLP